MNKYILSQNIVKTMTVTVTDDGVEVPEEFHDAEKIVIRTPNSTMDMSSGFSMVLQDGVYPLVSPQEFTDVDNPENPSLSPDKISFKAYGDDAEVFEVQIE